MSEHIPKVLLIDMVQAIDKLLRYTHGLSFQKYLDDEQVREAIYYNTLALGEAAYRMPDFFISQHPEIEWQKMISIRNVIAHGYDRIDDHIIWNIIKNNFT